MRIVVLLLLAAVGTARASVELEASLAPEAVVPPAIGTSSTASGIATFAIDDDGVVRWQLRVRDLSGFGTATTIRHGRIGENGPVVAALTNPPPTGDHVGTIAPLAADQLDALYEGTLYVTVATAAHPGGEVRGQVALTVKDGWTCPCAGSTPAAFRACVARRLRAASSLRRSAAGRTLRRIVRHARCGSPGRPPTCALPWTPIDNVLVERPCARLGKRACVRVGGVPMSGPCRVAPETLRGM